MANAVSSPSLLELAEDDMESDAAPDVIRGRGLGFTEDGKTEVGREAGRSSTKSGVCFCFCWMATRWFQKSRLERKPPRRLPTSSELALTFPPRFSQSVLFKLKDLGSAVLELICSRDAQED